MLRKISLIFGLCVLLSVSLMLPGFVAAQTASGGNQSPSSSSPSGQVPAPTVSFSNSPRPGSGDLINLAVSVMQGQPQVCGTTWSAHKTILPLGGALSEGFQGEIGTTVGNVSSTLEINLGDNYPARASASRDVHNYAVWQYPDKLLQRQLL